MTDLVDGVDIPIVMHLTEDALKNCRLRLKLKVRLRGAEEVSPLFDILKTIVSGS